MDYKLFLKKLYLNRKVNSIKSDYGKCLIIGGSKKYPGAPIIACLMAELTNCGYSAISVPSTIYNNAVNLVSPNTTHEVFSIDDDFYYSDDILADKLSSLYNELDFNKSKAVNGGILLSLGFKPSPLFSEIINQVSFLLAINELNKDNIEEYIKNRWC